MSARAGGGVEEAGGGGGGGRRAVGPPRFGGGAGGGGPPPAARYFAHGSFNAGWLMPSAAKISHVMTENRINSTMATGTHRIAIRNARKIGVGRKSANMIVSTRKPMGILAIPA